MPDVRARAVAALEWLDARWSLRRVATSLVGVVLLSMLALSAFIGIGAAYSAPSPAAIVPAETWMKAVSPAGGHASLAEAVVNVALVAPLLGIADAAGRLVYAYLLWVPLPVWQVAAWAAAVALYGMFGLNLVYLVWAMYRQSGLTLTGGGIDG